jgi:hypothetical protein
MKNMYQRFKFLNLKKDADFGSPDILRTFFDPQKIQVATR